MKFLWYEDDYQGKFLSVCIDAKTNLVLQSYQGLVSRVKAAIEAAVTEDNTSLQTQLDAVDFLKENNTGDIWPNILLDTDELRIRLVVDNADSIGLIAVLQNCISATLLDKEQYQARSYHLLNAIEALLKEVNTQVESKL